MIREDNLKTMLKTIGYVASTKANVFEKKYIQYDCTIEVDFNGSGSINYPEDNGMKITRKTTCNFSEPENFVVLECITRLMDKGYRPEHIELEKEWSLGHERKSGFADILVKDEDGKALFIVECKTSGNEYKKEYNNLQNDGGQLFSYWQQEGNCKWLSLYASDFDGLKVTYTTETIDCSDDVNILASAKKDNTILLYKDAHTVEELFTVWDETYDKRLCGDVIFRDDSQAYQIDVKPLRKVDLKDFSENDKVVNKFEEILRHNNVSDKENAFNRLIALFICKLVDEIQKGAHDIVDFQYKVGTDTYETLQDRLQRLHKEGMEKFMREKIFYVTDDYAENLVQQYTGHKRQKMIEDLRNTLRILKFYTNNDFAFKDVHNEELFYQNGKILVEVVQLFQKFRIIGSNDIQMLGDLFEQLLNKGFKQNEGQFFTPIPITHFIWDSLPIDNIIKKENGIDFPKIIDYACGAGHFLTQGFEAVNASVLSIDPSYKIEPSWAEHKIYGIEKDYRLARVSKISLFMHGAGDGNIIFGDGLENYHDKEIIPNSFDILVANPPYSVKAFKPHLKLKNNSLSILNKISNNGSEIETLFVERIAQLLKPNGIAAVVLPSSILNKESESFTASREILLQNFLIHAIVQLGAKTFGATPTNTVILFLEKYSEPPKRMDLITDSVTAIFDDVNLDNWEDNNIITEYLKAINVDKNTYYSFIRREKSFLEWQQYEYFKMYCDAYCFTTEYRNKISQKSFGKLPDSQKNEWITQHFYNYAFVLEEEKIKYFSLVYRQNTLIISAPDDGKKQEQFLGFKWSDKKGQEGIQILNHGGALFSEKSVKDPHKLSYLIYNSFINKKVHIRELDEYYFYSKLQDLMDFTSLSFNKVIKTTKPISQSNTYPKMSLNQIQVGVNGSQTKIEASQIAPVGTIPVISQTRDRIIEGYTDTTDPITDVPLVLFGDHTCIAKYIDFPFVRGADGTQLIKTDSSICLPQYLCIYLNFANITNKSKYERHFKYVKNLSIPIPPLPIQQEIIEKITEFDTLITNENNKNKSLHENIYNKFLEMFGDPISNSKSWQKDKLKNRCNVITGNTPSRKNPEYYGNYIEWIKSDNINTPFDYLTTATEYLSEEGLRVGKFVGAGSILMTCIAGSKECIGNIAIANRKVSFNQQINAIQPNNNDTWFLYALFALSRVELQNAASMNLKGILSKSKLEEIEFIFPPADLQTQFGKYAENIYQQIIISLDTKQKLENERAETLNEYIG